MAISLSERTTELINKMFDVQDRDLIKDLLINEAGDNISFCEESDPIEMERIRFSIIKISNGDLASFDKAMDLARVDWRDLFMAANFPEPNDHLEWYRKKSH